MNFLKNLQKHPSKSNSGFTLIEALIGLTLVSLIGIPVFTVFSDTISFTEKIKENNRWNRELIDLERSLRSSVSQIIIPFWIDGISINEGENILKVPWWNGDADSFLIIELVEDVLGIETPLEGTKLKGYDKFEFQTLKDNQSRRIGVSLSIKKINRDYVNFQCAFGSPGKEVFREN